MSTWERLFSHRKQKDDRLERINYLRIQLSEIDEKVVARSSQTAKDKSRQPDAGILRQGQSRRKARLTECLLRVFHVHMLVLDKKSHFPTFKPSILPESTAIAHRTGWSNIPVEERLAPHCKSSLKLTPRSTVSSSRPSSTDLSKSFIARLGEYEASRLTKESLRRDLDKHSFVPKIDSNSRAKCLLSGRDSRNTFTRLAVDDPKKRMERQKLREQQTCPFSPEIDLYSSILAVSKRAIDPGYCVYAPRASHAKPVPPSPVVTPRASRSKKYAHVPGKYNFRNPEEILLIFDESRRMKEAKSAQAEWEKAQFELKECTFQPNVSKDEPRSSRKPILIPGLDKFLARRDTQPKPVLKHTQHDGRLTVPTPFVFKN